MTIDDLGDDGMVRMTDEEIDGYLASQSVGVLGLPTDGAPSMRPMSYGYDGDSRLYFLYLIGSGSRKDELTRQAETARFLVYSAEATFNWRSVLLAGRLSEVRDAERETAEAALEGAWRPDVLERALATQATTLYEFEIDDRRGIKHLGLPEGFDELDESDEERAD
jgi:hypothetical protein